GDREKALAAYRAAYAADTMNYVAASNLAGLYNTRAEYDSALRYSVRTDQLQPTPASAGGVVMSTLLAQGVDSAEAAFHAALKSRPALANEPVAQAFRSVLYVARRQDDSLQALLATLRASPDRELRVSGLQFSMIDALAHGQLDRGVEYYQSLASLNSAASGQAHFDQLYGATVAIRITGDPDRGLALLDSALAGRTWADAAPSDRPYTAVASLYADAGRPQRAQQLLDAGLAEDPTLKAPDARTQIDGTRGDVLLAQGRYADAIRLYRRTIDGQDGVPLCRSCTDYSLARAFDLAGQPDSAIAYFERYLAVPEVERWFGAEPGVLLPLVHRRLGELYDERHDRARAMEHYSAFVDLWRDADPELRPSVKTVKARLAELASQ
ncbi:MAG TPA: tetratricopeptide repeat protein, partial [Gemmatimonadales bacterium]|nr:tetratricopeptide repeat protein [Gemmatimonadales bacterium]